MPTLAIKCPNCSKALKAPPQSIGKRVKCPKCGGRVSIIDPDAVGADEPAPDVADDIAAELWAREIVTVETPDHPRTLHSDC